jgi:hypothetical protein
MEIMLGNASAIGGYCFRIKSHMKEIRPLAGGWLAIHILIPEALKEGI